MTSETWASTYEHTFPDGKRLEVGWTFRCHGEKGKTYRYIKTVTNAEGDTWIECFGGSHQREQSRAFYPDRINTSSIKPPKRRAE